ncbi:unnamed protein product [Rotaria sp. Silwood2]|nr:unnamed protein product [Rotaria sp. Silwood2]CAF3072283.1 unnamed protein product [Rotaria sp. Silwood2]CAF3395521.1 unnamed protein product [Rotaria sp. Silwood2]CAF4300146.1 unnamed protein product [Rotaria sp. Silwood2]CAF4319368.1 unnamed protein product [Rotaria sp. Silwood2]
MIVWLFKAISSLVCRSWFYLYIVLYRRVSFFITRYRSSQRLTYRNEQLDILYLKRRFPLNTIRLVCCDPSVNEESITALRKVDRELVLVNNWLSCEKVVKKLHREECKSVLLILAESVVNQVLPEITSDVHTVFIHSPEQTSNANLINHPKVNSICPSSPELIEHVQDVSNLLEHGYINENEQQSLRNLSKNTANFLWFHLFRNVIRYLNKSEKAKNDMMKRFREYFNNNSEQLKRLQNFAENYHSSFALMWYTEPAFISDVINKAMRSLDIDALFDLRYCIIDICQLLEKRPRPKDSLTVYRGVLMDKDKFESMQTSIVKGDLISMRGFFSTSSQRPIAEMFASNDKNELNKAEIIYEIDVSSDLEHIIYADISDLSQFPDEKEILFDLDSTFEFKKIITDEKKKDRYIIQLRATDRGWHLAEKYISYNNLELTQQMPEILFGRLLIEMGNADKAISYFQGLLIQANNQEQDRINVLSSTTCAIVMNNIGHAWKNKGDFDQALQWFDLAVDIQNQESQPIYTMLASMTNRGVIFMLQGKYELALNAYQQVLDIANQYQINGHLSHIYANMGSIKDMLGEYEEAIILHQKAGDALRTEGVHDGHPSMAENLLNIAFIYLNQARWNEAIKLLEEAKTIYEHILPSTHPDIARTIFSIGIALRSKRCYDEAFECMARALKIYEQAYDHEHAHIANTYNSMANINSVQNRFDQALPLYTKAYEQFRKLYGTDEHADIGRVLNNIGQVYRKLEDFPPALDYLQRALHIRQITLGVNHPDTATTLVNLSLVYYAQGNLSTALDYAKRGLIIRRNKLPVDNEDIQETEDFVAQLEQKISISDQT